MEEGMRNISWIIAGGLAAATTGCNSPYGTTGYGTGGYGTGYGGGGGSGYGFAPTGYSQGYGYSQPTYSQAYAPNYYRPPAVNNYYVQPQPQVINNTRYVPVPEPERHGGNWANNNGNNDRDHQWQGHGQPQGQTQGQSGDHRPQQHDWHAPGNQQAGNQTPHTPAPTPTPQQPRQHGSSSQDHNGDGRPDGHDGH
jgi:hypothetical protein